LIDVVVVKKLINVNKIASNKKLRQNERKWLVDDNKL